MSAAAGEGGEGLEGVVRTCALPNAPAGWPAMRVLAVSWRSRRHPAGAIGRDAIRRATRRVLRDHGGTDAACRALDLPREQRGAQTVSVSHDGSLSLLAWCASGALGIDLLVLDQLTDATPGELGATAALYLGPEAARGIHAASVCDARLDFAKRWVCMEARAKCRGLALDEWHPARGRLLAEAACVRLEGPDAQAPEGRAWVGALAWRPAKGTP